LRAEPRPGGEAPRGVEAIGLVVLHLAQVFRAVADDDVAGRARAAAPAGVLERHVEIFGDIEKRLGFPVMGIRQLPSFKLDGL
jgi:hypothetical protein